MSTIGLIVAGGSGERFGGDIPKQYRLVAGRPLLSWTLSRFERAASIDRVVIVAAEDFLLHVHKSIVEAYGFEKVFKIVPGGVTRTESVWRGLQALPLSTSYVAVHDGVRPLVKPGDIDRVMEEAQKQRAAILARPAADTVKRARENMVISTLDRANLFLAETPQAFQFDLLKEAYNTAVQTGQEFTDDAAVVEAIGFMVRLVISSAANPKLTTAEDLDYMEMILERESRE